VSATTQLCQEKPGVQRTRARWRPACDRELVPLSEAQCQAQPVAAHVGSLSLDRSARTRRWCGLAV